MGKIHLLSLLSPATVNLNATGKGERGISREDVLGALATLDTFAFSYLMWAYGGDKKGFAKLQMYFTNKVLLECGDIAIANTGFTDALAIAKMVLCRRVNDTCTHCKGTGLVASLARCTHCFGGKSAKANAAQISSYLNIDQRKAGKLLGVYKVFDMACGEIELRAGEMLSSL